MDEIATRKADGGQSKDVKAVTVTTSILWCYREHKFDKPDDKRKTCHSGLKKLDFNICPNCIWFGQHPQTQKKLLTGAEAMVVASALKTIKETHDPMVPKNPALNLDGQTPPEALEVRTSAT